MDTKVVALHTLEGIGGVLCHGCFDLVHIGHIRHMIAAKALCPDGPLTVTITSDRFINKGPWRPAFNEDIRAEWLSALACVDHVAIVDEPTGVPAILTIKPRWYVKGRDYEGEGVIAEEQEAVRYVGGRLVYLHSGEQYSSTGILKELSWA